MKTVTITALVATLIAIPLFLLKRNARLQAQRCGDEGEEEQRYDLFDLLS
jgi:hypothetical protein